MTNLVISWNTKKEENGTFTAICTGIAHRHFEVLKSVPGFKTRAQAKGHAIKWMRYLKSQRAA